VPWFERYAFIMKGHRQPKTSIYRPDSYLRRTRIQARVAVLIRPSVRDRSGRATKCLSKA
jgi:hypothetical protein